MKLAKSLLLSSAVGLTAVASAQAADLPFRKAAPVEYVRVCDFTGAGYFYIPGTDTCLKIGGYLRADFAYIEPTNVFFPTVNATGAVVPGVGVTGRGTAAGTILKSANRNATGLRAEGRVDVDARTQTAYGTLRTYVRFQADAAGGNFAQNPAGAAISSPAGTVGVGGTTATNVAYIDKGFIQFAGFTAGRVQSFFDFYADNYNFESIANSDTSNQVFAYTATFGGGFSATIAVEDAFNRRNGIRNTIDGQSLGVATNVNYGGEQLPDFVGTIRLDQAWGAAQLSAAYHNVNAVETGTNIISGDNTREQDKDGFAVQAGVQIKLPMLAAGDDIWLEGAYQQGAYRYQDTAGSLNAGFNFLAVGGFVHQDADAIAFRNANGSYSTSLSKGFSVMGALHHYFTPNFSDVLFGSYQEVTYGNRAKNLDWTLGGLGDGSEYRIGNQFIWTPVNNLSMGLEFIYMHIDQTLAHNPGVAATALPAGISKNPDAFEGRVRIERDF